MQDLAREIQSALDILELPPFISKDDIKKQYYFLAKKQHPDLGGSAKKMEQINVSYALLMKYIEEFRYTFDEEEVFRQNPGVNHVQRFKT
ncbi:MAG: heat-shock protein [Sulfurovum sp.]|nr:MAG: heat-shock protein [Sulfurovum sp.]